MSDIVESPLGLMEELRRVEDAGVLYAKGYKNTDIAELLEIPLAKVKNYVQEYKFILERKADEDPDFFERVQYNTFKMLAELDEISKEAWESVTIATDNSMITARIHALKLALEVNTKKAQLHQLLTGGGSKADKEYVARMQKAESVNQILSQVIKDVVSDCPVCREKARVLLAEAFSMMPTHTEDAEIVE